MRDPFYQQIIKRLNGPIDPDLFEACASDILRTDFPALVPVRGGSDAGMDGAIADGRGLPFPLVCTTSKNVIGNLTKNLKSYLDSGGTRREAVLATTYKLTPRQRRNLEARARELGFILVQIYAQEAIADRLYYNQRWCLDLLNLTGDPSPISIVPRTARPLLGETLIGRENDITWVNDIKGDRLLVGQPGSGKTFLLHLFAKHGGGLFIIRRELAAIASAIRTQNPKALIVDDAHLFPDFLPELRQLREQIGASFEIIATSWPGARVKVAEDLNLPTSHIHQLELLTRDEIVEIIKSSGIQGPVELIREIVNQAQGRPGLAVTLSYLCLNGDIQKVALGDALRGSMLATFEPLVGKKASVILAAFSLGGDSGMSMKAVADALQESEIDIHCIVTELASGGVTTEISRTNTLSVNPAALRFGLVRDIFFRGPTSLDSTQLIESAPNLKEVAFTLIGAKARGAHIPPDQLLMILENTQSDEVWEAYAWLGQEEANTVLDRHPELLVNVARAALHVIPERVIPLLLKAAAGDNRALHSTTNHPLRLISDWITKSYPGSGEVIKRREILLKVIKNFLSEGFDTQGCLKALSFIFTFRFERHTVDPGSGMTVTYTHGTLTLDEVNSIGNFWPDVLSIIRRLKKPDWVLILELVEKCAYPGPVMTGSYPGFYEATNMITSRMLNDLVSLHGITIGILHRLKGIGQKVNLKLKTELDRDFVTLYPWRESSDWKTTQEHQNNAVVKLSKKWAKASPDQIVKKIVSFETEAKNAGISYPRWTHPLCREIAQRVIFRLPWIKVMIEAEATDGLIEPFLRQAVLNDESGWKETIDECLSDKKLRWAAITILLTIPSPPAHLLNKALQYLEGFAQIIETLCLRREVPEGTLIQLLRHPDPLIAGGAAIGEWQSDPEGEIRSVLRDDWKKAILRLDYKEYWLGEILKRDSDLSNEWLGIHIRRKEIPYEMLKIYRPAITSLSLKKRKELIKILPRDTWRSDIVCYLIGDSLELYQFLLKDKNKKAFHLFPLRGFKNESFGEEVWDESSWIERAKVALDVGYAPEDIAGAIFSSGWSWSGNISDMWRCWIDRYDRLCSNNDPRIRKTGEIGKENASKELKRSLEEERRAAIYGLG